VVDQRLAVQAVLAGAEVAARGELHPALTNPRRGQEDVCGALHRQQVGDFGCPSQSKAHGIVVKYAPEPIGPPPGSNSPWGVGIDVAA
jgi:hypothetical protein